MQIKDNGHGSKRDLCSELETAGCEIEIKNQDIRRSRRPKVIKFQRFKKIK